MYKISKAGNIQHNTMLMLSTFYLFKENIRIQFHIAQTSKGHPKDKMCCKKYTGFPKSVEYPIH